MRIEDWAKVSRSWTELEKLQMAGALAFGSLMQLVESDFKQLKRSEKEIQHYEKKWYEILSSSEHAC